MILEDEDGAKTDRKSLSAGLENLPLSSLELIQYNYSWIEVFGTVEKRYWRRRKNRSTEQTIYVCID